MTPNLPNRWQEILQREAAKNVGEVLARARETPGVHRVPRWALPAAAVLIGSFSVFGLLDANDARKQGNVPFDRSTVISTRTAGLGASPEDLEPRPTPAPLPPPTLAPAAPGEGLRRPQTPRGGGLAGPSQRRAGRPDCPECEARQARMLAAEQSSLTSPTPAPAVPAPTPKPKAAPLVVNVGTRIPAVLTDPVITGAALAPVTAKLAQDVMVGDRIALPAGVRLIGEAFATEEGDRVQVVFSSVIVNGVTHRIEGWALQDGEVGLKGRVLKKGSKGKKGAAALLGAAASGLTYGVAGAIAGAPGAALSSLGSSVATDMQGLGREWRYSDKVGRVEAGVGAVVYLRRDFSVE